MAGRNPRSLVQRDESAHAVLQDAVDAGYLDTDREYDVPGIASHRAANEARLSVNRGAPHLGVAVACWVTDNDGNSCYKDCQDGSAAHGVRFKVFSKNKARTHVVRQSGGDPAKLRYNPFAKAAGPIVDENGKRL